LGVSHGSIAKTEANAQTADVSNPNGASLSKKRRWFYQPQIASSRFSRTPANRTLARRRLIGD